MADGGKRGVVGLAGAVGLVIKRHFDEVICGCTSHCKGGKCGCSLCTYTAHNSMRLQRGIINWHTGTNKK